MLTALMIMVREGFEASLVVAILAAYLRRIDRLDLRSAMWQGIAAAAALSVVAAVVIDLTVGTLAGAARMRAFAAISIFAVVVLTWMVFWMRRQSRHLAGDLHRRLDAALLSGDVRTAVFVVAFIAVLREGLEAALFLVAIGTSASGAQVALGAVIGLAIAVALGVAVNVFGRHLPIKQFFKVTGMIIVVFAAGLAARSVLFLQAAGDLGTVYNNVYDLTSVSWLTQETEVGKFLAAMLGWDPRPSIEQVLAWLLYLVPVSYLFLRKPTVKAAPPSTAEPAPADPGAAKVTARS